MIKTTKTSSVSTGIDNTTPLVHEDYGMLCEYATGEELREATREERDESREAAEHDGGAGIILVGEMRCYVQE